MSERGYTYPDPTSRFVVTDIPTVTPGKCAVCGGVERPVIDFKQTIQFYGAVLLCSDCIKEAASYFDMVPLAKLESLERSLVQTFQQYLDANNLKVLSNEQYESAVAAIGGLSDIFLYALADSSSVVESQAEFPEFSLFSGIEEDDSGSFSSAAARDELAIFEGPDVFSSDSSNGSFSL